MAAMPKPAFARVIKSARTNDLIMDIDFLDGSFTRLLTPFLSMEFGHPIRSAFEAMKQPILSNVSFVVQFGSTISVRSLQATGPPSCHRTNTGQRIRQTVTSVSDGSRFRRLAGRIIMF